MLRFYFLLSASLVKMVGDILGKIATETEVNLPHIKSFQSLHVHNDWKWGSHIYSQLL